MNLSHDRYLTIAAALRAPELKVLGSRFITDLAPVSSKEEVEAVLDRIRTEFYDATHHCYAYRLGNLGEQERAADNGEPSGTAGKPILMVLAGAELTNVLCVVTRYFGGTKLGTGGLARAYADAAQLAVSEATIKEVFLLTSLHLHASYDELPALERLIAQKKLDRGEAIYGDTIEVEVKIRRSLAEALKDEIQEKFFGRVKVF